MDERQPDPVEELDLHPVAPPTAARRSPKALWAALAVLAVAAGAVVIASNDDEPNRPGLPVDLAAASRRGPEAAADAMLAYITYVPGDDLPALGGEAIAYRVPGSVDEARVRTLADALGLDGDVQVGPDGSWSVDGAGGIGRLDVHRGIGAYWSWSAGLTGCVSDAGGEGACTSAGGGVAGSSTGGVADAPCEPGTQCPTTTVVIEACGPAALCQDTGGREDPGSACEDDDCVAADEPVPAPDVPPTVRTSVAPPDDVARIALDVAAASGVDVEDAAVSGVDGASGDGTSTWFVTIEPRLGGVPSGLLTFVEVGADGEVISGSGMLGTPEALGRYPLLDTRAALDRANATMGAATDLPVRGGAEVEGTGGDDGDTVVTTVGDANAITEPGTDPCATPEGASDGCGGTTGCRDDCVVPTTTIPCKVQPDGTEICEAVPLCPQVEATSGADVGAPDVLDCTPPTPIEPLPIPEPLEIVLVDAEPSLVLLPGTDGRVDAFLVPAYRFTAEDGGQVDLPAVADEALAGPPPNEITVPETVPPDPVPEPEPQPDPCEVLEEEDSSGTTHTVQTCPTPNEDPRHLRPGEEPTIGVGYHVDLDLSCPVLRFADDLWIDDDGTVHGWAEAGEDFEGGTFTLVDADHGTFVGDAEGTKVAGLRRLGPAEDAFCEPRSRP